MYQCIVSVILLLFSILSFGRSTAKESAKEFIVKFKMEQGSPVAFPDSSPYEIVRPLVPSMGLYLVKSKSPQNGLGTMSILRQESSVVYAQADHAVTLRSTEPRDTDFSRQWSLKNISAPGSDIKATDAWDLGVGGKDPSGNELVIAIVDGGMDLTHEDLASNLWTNAGEIPENGIDDDGNGFIDDINGWNAFGQNGKINAASHGTHVAGIAGAAGNNGKHISGINWNVKLMAVVAASAKTSVILEGYGYVLKQKQLWLQSQGKKGANVVVTNSSFGVDDEKCDSGEFPAWNDIYNEMGKAGILSAAATANNKVNVDEKGDIPTGCASEWLVTVTNTDKTDAKYPDAGFGKNSIDLGAPGTAIYSTLPGNKAGEKTGTSMATPHVAGAIAFLYSVLNKDLLDEVKRNPGTAALRVKEILLTHVDPIESLKGKTVTGGRLNLFKAATAAAH